MRSLIIGLVVFLTACNGSTTEVQKVPYTDPQVTAKIDALTQALADATHAQAQEAVSLRKLTLIGKVHGVSTESIRMQGEFRTEAVSTASNFGPCTDMGVLVGFTNTGNNTGAGALSASYQAFKTCSGYLYETSVQNGDIKQASRIFWDGPNCTGNQLEWESGGAGYNTQSLVNGVVFISPVDGTTQLMVRSNQTPQPILIQSAWVSSNPGCQSDIETQLMYQVTPNDVNVTGVPNKTVGNFSLVAP